MFFIYFIKSAVEAIAIQFGFHYEPWLTMLCCIIVSFAAPIAYKLSLRKSLIVVAISYLVGVLAEALLFFSMRAWQHPH